MLNTDAHSSQIKNKMTKAEFTRNNRGINAGADLPAELLESVYEDISSHEIKTGTEYDDLGESELMEWLRNGAVLSMSNPTPDPTPEPTPEPTPNPTPDPTPDPNPNPNPNPYPTPNSSPTQAPSSASTRSAASPLVAHTRAGYGYAPTATTRSLTLTLTLTLAR